MIELHCAGPDLRFGVARYRRRRPLRRALWHGGQPSRTRCHAPHGQGDAVHCGAVAIHDGAGEGRRSLQAADVVPTSPHLRRHVQRLAAGGIERAVPLRWWVRHHQAPLHREPTLLSTARQRCGQGPVPEERLGTVDQPPGRVLDFEGQPGALWRLACRRVGQHFDPMADAVGVGRQRWHSALARMARFGCRGIGPRQTRDPEPCCTSEGERDDQPANAAGEGMPGISLRSHGSVQSGQERYTVAVRRPGKDR